jgi:hypothetical protein
MEKKKYHRNNPKKKIPFFSKMIFDFFGTNNYHQPGRRLNVIEDDSFNEKLMVYIYIY